MVARDDIHSSSQSRTANLNNAVLYRQITNLSIVADVSRNRELIEAVATGIDKRTDSTNMTPPAEYGHFLDQLITSLPVKKAKVRNRFHLTSVCFYILMKRLGSNASKHALRGKPDPHDNLWTNKTAANFVARSCESPFMLSMWIPAQTTALTKALDGLMREHIPEYRKRASLFDITADDIEQAIEEAQAILRKEEGENSSSGGNSKS